MNGSHQRVPAGAFVREQKRQKFNFCLKQSRVMKGYLTVATVLNAGTLKRKAASSYCVGVA